jgi:hypothetical protein
MKQRIDFPPHVMKKPIGFPDKCLRTDTTVWGRIFADFACYPDRSVPANSTPIAQFKKNFRQTRRWHGIVAADLFLPPIRWSLSPKRQP